MNRITSYISLILLLMLAACNHNEPEIIQPPVEPPVEEVAENTLLMYYPWSGSTNTLTQFFYANINDMEKSITANGMESQRIIVFIANKIDEAVMFEIKYDKTHGVYRDTIDNFPSHSYNTAEGIAAVLSKTKEVAPANNYSMIIGAHGMAWLPGSKAPASQSVAKGTPAEKYHWEYSPSPEFPFTTRWFGGTDFQTNISTLANALTESQLKMRYILFDDCYMSSIEVAYELRGCTDYLIGSTCEIMDIGMPYEVMGKYLLGDADYEGIVESFHTFYSSYKYPYGTIGVIKLDEIEALAAIMKEINAKHTIPTGSISSIQKLDGYSPTYFFDMGHYVEILAGNDTELYPKFAAQLERTVPHKANTEYYYSMSAGRRQISHYSGVLTSDPSTASTVTASISQTQWYKATH